MCSSPVRLSNSGVSLFPISSSSTFRLGGIFSGEKRLISLCTLLGWSPESRIYLSKSVTSGLLCLEISLLAPAKSSGNVDLEESLSGRMVESLPESVFNSSLVLSYK